MGIYGTTKFLLVFLFFLHDKVVEGLVCVLRKKIKRKINIFILPIILRGVKDLGF
jgi:hypothetical protein